MFDFFAFQKKRALYPLHELASLVRNRVIFSFAKIDKYRWGKEINFFIFLANSTIVQPLSMLSRQTLSGFLAVLLVNTLGTRFHGFF